VKTLFVLTVFGGGLAGATLAPALRIADIAPDIPLIVVIFLALRRGPEVGCAAGFVAGLLQDVAAGGLIGVQALTKALAGFVLGSASGRLRVTQPLVQIPGLVLLTIAEGILRFTLLQLFRFPAPFGELMAFVVLPQALYNGFIGAALVFALAWTDALKERAT